MDPTTIALLTGLAVSLLANGGLVGLLLKVLAGVQSADKSVIDNLTAEVARLQGQVSELRTRLQQHEERDRQKDMAIAEKEATIRTLGEEVQHLQSLVQHGQEQVRPANYPFSPGGTT